MTLRPTRRAFVLALALAPLSCRRTSAAGERCPHCGMLVDPKSPFRAEIVPQGGGAPVGFDTPRCALVALRRGSPAGTLRLREYYTQAAVEADAVRFVAGSDVEGPMGEELVPVSPDKVEKFMRDHRGARVYGFGDVTLEILAKEGAP